MNGSSFDRWTRKLASHRSRRAFLHSALGTGVALALAGGQQTTIARPDKVTLCHHTGNARNPYRIISVPSNAVNAHIGHGDFEAISCDHGWSCETCPPCELLPLFCNSTAVCPTGATEFCPGGPLDPSSSDQARAACEACFGVGACVDNDQDCSGAGWLLDFSPAPEPTAGTPVFGYEIGVCNPDNPQPPGRVFYGTASDPLSDYGYWGTATCP